MSSSSNANADPVTGAPTQGGHCPFALVLPDSKTDDMAIRVTPSDPEAKRSRIPLLDGKTWAGAESDQSVFDRDPTTCDDFISMSEFSGKCKELYRALDESSQKLKKDFDNAYSRETLEGLSRGEKALEDIDSKLSIWIGQTSKRIIDFNEDRHKSDLEKIERAVKSLSSLDEKKRSLLISSSCGEHFRRLANSHIELSDLYECIDPFKRNTAAKELWSTCNEDCKTVFDKIMKPQGNNTESLVDQLDNDLKRGISTVFGPDAKIPKNLKDWQTLCSTVKSAPEASALSGASIHQHESTSDESDIEDFDECSSSEIGDGEEVGTETGFVLLGRE